MIIGATLILPLALNPNDYKPQIIDAVKKQIGRDVRIDGEIKLTLLPSPGIVVEGIRIANSKQGKQEFFASLEALKVNVSLGALFSKTLSVNKISLVNPKVVLEQYKNGQNNWQFSPLKDRSDSTEQKTEGGNAFNFAIKDVTISGGEISYFQDKETIAVTQIALSGQLDALEGPMSFKGSLEILDEKLDFETEIKAITEKSPFTLLIKNGDHKVSFVGAFNQQETSLRGDLTLNGNLSSFPFMHSINLPKSILKTIELKSKVSLNTQRVHLSGIQGLIDQNSIKGKLVYDFKKQQFNGEFDELPGATALKIEGELLKTQGIIGKIDLNSQKPTHLLSWLEVPQESIHPDLLAPFYLKARLESQNSQLVVKDLVINQSNRVIKGNSTFKNEKDDLFAEFNIEASSIRDYLKIYGVDLPADPGKISLKGQINGNMKALSTDITLGIALGTVTLKGRLRDLNKNLNYALQCNMNFPSLKTILAMMGAKSGSIPLSNLKMQTYLNGSATKVAMKQISANFGYMRETIQLTGSADFAQTSLRPKLSGKFVFSPLSIDKITESSSGQSGERPRTVSAKSSSGSAKKIHWDTKEMDLSWLKSFDGDFEFSSSSVMYDDLNFQNINATTRLANGILQISNLTANLFGGKFHLTMRLDHNKNNGLSSKILLDDAHINRILKDMKDVRITKGKLDLSSDLTTEGTSEYDFVKNLNGFINLKSTNGMITGFDLQAISDKFGDIVSLDSVLSLISGSLTKGNTPFSSLDGTLLIQNGKINISKIELIARGGEGRATGYVDLPQYRMDVKAEIKLPAHPEFPPFGARVHGFLDNPKRSIETAALKQYLLLHVFNEVIGKVVDGGVGVITEDVPGLLNGKTVNKLLDKVLPGDQSAPKQKGSEARPQEPGQEQGNPVENIIQKPEKVLKNVLDKLF